MRLVLVCIIGLIVVVPAAGFQESIRLRMSNYLPLQSVAVSKIMAPWSESIENKSAGRIKFVSYYGGALGRGPHRQYLLTEKGVSDVSTRITGNDADTFCLSRTVGSCPPPFRS